jgi:hypothetical protein
MALSKLMRGPFEEAPLQVSLQLGKRNSRKVLCGAR